MRILSVVLVGALGCGSPVRPTVLPTVDSLPDDQQRRDERLESIAVRPGPETRPRLAPKLDAAETVAATAAALLGMAYSRSSNVELGFEFVVVEPGGDPGQRGAASANGANAPEPTPNPNALVPWVNLPSSTAND
ncbi:MAG: hypothetical protein AB7O24_23265 [Kofleriaceae bacterium]